MKKRKQDGFMDRILKFIAVLLLGFTITMIIVYCKTGGIPDTLCTCVFGICGGECGGMGWRKTTKERKQERKYTLQDREYDEQLARERESAE